MVRDFITRLSQSLLGYRISVDSLISSVARFSLTVSINAESLGHFYSFIGANDEIYIRRKPPNMNPKTYQRLTSQ